MPFGIRIGTDYLAQTNDGDYDWTPDAAAARKFDTHAAALVEADEINAALEDGLDDPIEIVQVETPAEIQAEGNRLWDAADAAADARNQATAVDLPAAQAEYDAAYAAAEAHADQHGWVEADEN